MVSLREEILDLRKQSNVELLEECEVMRLLASPRDNRMVCQGVEVRSRPAGGSMCLEGDLIIDASGGNAKSNKWLEQLGLTAPEEEVLDPLLTYAGQWLRMRDGAKWLAPWWWTHGVFIQRVPPDDIRGAHLMKQENDRWLLTLVAGSAQSPPTDPEGTAKFVSELRSPLIAQMLPLFESMSKMTSYRLSKNRWRHYEPWKEDLSGYIAIGDAACVFNPNQGQGMSVAATEAGILRQCLKETISPELLPKRFFAAQAKFQINPWWLAVCNDLRFSSVAGQRTTAIRFFNWYRERLAVSRHRNVQRRLNEVDSLLRPVNSLFDPLIVTRALGSSTISTLRKNEFAQMRFAPSPPALAP
jgi:2-polyprenyl-6-methoxyphenol hydroxylase-like FAD-dependent oxidoreductase